MDRIIAAHWFDDDQIVVVDSIVVEKDIENEQDRVFFKEVLAQIVLNLRCELPSGQLTREATMEENLRVIAESFGSDVSGHPDEVSERLYSGLSVVI